MTNDTFVNSIEDSEISLLDGLSFEELEHREAFGFQFDGCACSCSCDCTSCSCIVSW